MPLCIVALFFARGPSLLSLITYEMGKAHCNAQANWPLCYNKSFETFGDGKLFLRRVSTIDKYLI